MKHALEFPATASEQPDGDEHGVRGLRDLRGLLIRDQDLIARLPYGRATFYKFKAEGRFDFLLASPQVGNVSTYSGTLVQRWLDGAGGPARRRPVKSAANAR